MNKVVFNVFYDGLGVGYIFLVVVFVYGYVCCVGEIFCCFFIMFEWFWY